VAYIASGVPLFIHAEGDASGERIAAVQMMELGLASQTELSAALGYNRSTLFRQHRALKNEGVLGVVDKKRGPQGRHRFSAERRRRVQRLLNEGASIRKAAEAVGVSEGIVRHALYRGDLERKSDSSGEANLIGPQARSRSAAQGEGGVAVSRHGERALARMGQLSEAAPQFTAVEAVRYGGAMLAVPALLMQGLLEVGEQTYGTLKNGFYGLRSILLVLALMALLRIRTSEQLQGHPPGELGILLGLDRAPEVKTLRRKLWELAGRKKAAVFSRRLAERWVDESTDQVGLLYIDGHVRPYHGTKHQLPKAFVSRRRLCMPATTDFWVNQQDSQPLFVVTAEANDDLIAILRERILVEIRSLVGTDRPVTLVFDREGWSPVFFRELSKQNFPVISYRKGKYAEWPIEEFKKITGTIDGRKVSYKLAERRVEVIEGFQMREIRRLCDSGHQTAILTTRDDLKAEVAAYRMFERWTQENFFRYMRQHFSLDALVTYAVEPADEHRMVLNPQRKELAKQKASNAAMIKELTASRGRNALREAGVVTSKSSGKEKRLDDDEIDKRLDDLRAENKYLREKDRSLPKRVPIRDLMDPADIVKLAPEAKHLTDTIKMIVYRAETVLVRSLEPHYARTEDEGRALLREIFMSAADIIPQPDQDQLLVRLHSLSNARSNRALGSLCELLNAQQITYPGTNLTIHYQPPEVA
jgi:transposase-like protein